MTLDQNLAVVAEGIDLQLRVRLQRPPLPRRRHVGEREVVFRQIATTPHLPYFRLVEQAFHIDVVSAVGFGVCVALHFTQSPVVQDKGQVGFPENHIALDKRFSKGKEKVIGFPHAIPAMPHRLGLLIGSALFDQEPSPAVLELEEGFTVRAETLTTRKFHQSLFHLLVIAQDQCGRLGNEPVPFLNMKGVVPHAG